MGRKSISVTEEQHEKLAQVKELYKRDLKVEMNWGEFLMSLGIAYYVGRQALIEGSHSDIEVIAQEGG